MNIVSSLAVAAFFIYLLSGIYVLKINFSNRMNRLFLLQCLSLAIWAFTAFIIYSLQSREAVILWYKISSFGFGLYYALVLHLYLHFTRNRLTKLKFAALYLPALIIIAATWFSYTLFEDFIFVNGQWKFIPAFSRTGFYIYIAYYFSYVIFTVTILLRWQFSAESRKEKLQSRVTAQAFITTVTVCTITDFILPVFPWYKLPALAPVILVINTCAIFYAFQKYKFLSPVKDIFDGEMIFSHNEIAVMVSRKNRVITVNNQFCEYFGCLKDDVAGMYLEEWFSADESLIENIKLLDYGISNTGCGVLKYNKNDKTSFNAECSRVSDKFGDHVGTLVILHELVERNLYGYSSAGNLISSQSAFTESNSDPELARVEKKWGIDLTGRKMWYAPWPVDDTFNYRRPGAEEIYSTFSISGEAVNETLLYFEECGGDTGLLVSMLCDHMADKRFVAGRDTLLVKTRWYSDEFYFYFIMFTKKVIGRYDFHFGENSNEQLSIHHKIYEKGFMEYIPYGKTGQGFDVHDVTTNNVLGLLLYLENVPQKDTSDIINFINANLDQRYVIGRDFYNNESIWCSLEFIEYGFEFSRIIANSRNFFADAAVYSFFNGLRVGKLMFLVPGKIALSLFESGISKVNNIHDIKFDNKRGYTKFLITIKPEFKIQKYSKYLKASLRNDSAIYRGAIAAILQKIYGLQEIPESDLIINDNTSRISFSIEYRWYIGNYNIFRMITGCIIISIAAVIGTYQLGIFFYTAFLVLVISLLVYFFNQKKDLSDKLMELQIASGKQLEAFERTTSDLLDERNTLEQKVEERTKELIYANTRLNELDRLKSDFFANISHEIRTPLTLILTPIESLLYNDTNIIPDRGFFESIYSNSLRLLGLINNLLDFSRLDAGNSKLTLQKINIISILQSHIEAVRSMNKVKGIELQVEFETEKLIINADPDKIDKIIANLFSNAIKFTDRGGRIIVKVYKESVNDSEFCIISIVDTGIGIPGKHLGCIFDRFSRVESRSSSRYQGTGIGLALVREFVKLHDGTISVDSRHIDQYPETHGSTFIIKIPAAKEDHLSDDAGVQTQNGSGEKCGYARQYIDLHDTGTESENSKTENLTESADHKAESIKAVILIVEDNSGMHTLLDEILGENYNIIRACNGMEALTLLDSEDNVPDLILSDIMMPEMDGYEFIRNIRKDPRFEGIPVIFLTARAEMNMKLEGFDTGATDYIIKPFNSRELTARIRTQIELKTLRDKLLNSNRQLYAKLERLIRTNMRVSDSSDKKIKEVIEFIDENYTANISREGIALSVEMSPDHLSRLFNKITGKRIDSYINELRIKRAKKELAETDKPVISVAMDAGFENLRTFNRLFKEFEALTPKEYRSRFKKQIH